LQIAHSATATNNRKSGQLPRDARRFQIKYATIIATIPVKIWAMEYAVSL
jgi:hypothetical protein